MSVGSMNFHKFLAAVLADASIPAKVLPNSGKSGQTGQRPSGHSSFEAASLIVVESHEQAAKAVIDYTVQNCKICLICDESFVKPDESVCPLCGHALDPRCPDEIRTQYIMNFPDSLTG